MTQTTFAIQDIANEFDRLFAADAEIVDASPISWGHGQSAGHMGHGHSDEPSVVGWYCDGGNCGHPIMSIANDDMERAGAALAAMQSASSLSQIERAFDAAGVRYERLA